MFGHANINHSESGLFSLVIALLLKDELIKIDHLNLMIPISHEFISVEPF